RDVIRLWSRSVADARLSGALALLVLSLQRLLGDRQDVVLGRLPAGHAGEAALLGRLGDDAVGHFPRAFERDVDVLPADREWRVAGEGAVALIGCRPLDGDPLLGLDLLRPFSHDQPPDLGVGRLALERWLARREGGGGEGQENGHDGREAVAHGAV